MESETGLLTCSICRWQRHPHQNEKEKSLFNGPCKCPSHSWTVCQAPCIVLHSFVGDFESGMCHRLAVESVMLLKCRRPVLRCDSVQTDRRTDRRRRYNSKEMHEANECKPLEDLNMNLSLNTNAIWNLCKQLLMG